MTPQDDEAKSRNRFLLINLARIGGIIVLLLGLVIWQTDRLRQGGSWEIGVPLALLGLIASFVGPQLLASRWKTPPQ